MDMCYDGALVLPSSYAVMDEEEMSYVEGGALSKVDKALIIGICAASAITLTVALVYGQLALAAKILRWSVKRLLGKLERQLSWDVLQEHLGFQVELFGL